MSVKLSEKDQQMLAGRHGEASKLAMSILVRMAEVCGAEEMMDVTQAHIDALKVDAQIQRDQVRLQAVELELNRLRAMESGVVAEARLEDTEIEHEELATRIRASQQVLEGLRDLHSHATVRVEEFVAGLAGI